MSSNRYSIEITDKISAANKSAPEKVMEVYSSTAEYDLSEVERSASESAKKAIAFYREHQETLWQCMEKITPIVDAISATYPPDRTMGSGFNADIEIMINNLNEKGEPRIRLSFNDFQTKNNNHVTGACAGYFKALSDAGFSRKSAELSFNSMGNEASIIFDSLLDLVISLNARAKSQAEKIVIDGSTRPNSIG